MSTPLGRFYRVHFLYPTADGASASQKLDGERKKAIQIELATIIGKKFHR